MNRIKRHLPGFVDHDEEDLVEVDFETSEELLKIEWIDRWTKNPKFLGFTVGRDGASRKPLICELSDGGFWVMGMMKEDVPDLPTWNKDVCDARRVTA